jgi:methyl-accepting chemotaxis protein
MKPLCGLNLNEKKRQKNMRAQWTIGKKLIMSFIGVAAIVLIMGIFGYYGAVKNEEVIEDLGTHRLPAVGSLLIIKENAENIGGIMATLAIPGLSLEIRQRQYTDLAEARKSYEAAWKVYETLPQANEEAELWKQLVVAWGAWRAENTKAVESAKQWDALTAGYDQKARAKDMSYLDALRSAETKAMQASIAFKTQIQEWKNILIRGNDQKRFDSYLAGFEKSEKETQTYLAEALDLMKQLGLQAGVAEELIASHKELSEKYRTALKQFVPSDTESGKKVDALVAGVDRAAMKGMTDLAASIDQSARSAHSLNSGLRDQILGPAYQRSHTAIALLDKIVQINRDMAAADVKEGHAQASFLEILMSVSMIIGVAAALALGILITRSINRNLSRIIAGLTEGAEEVASASGQVSSAAQSLAEGSSEQAASIEETSSSLEEMSSMTKQNADNAQQANGLMGEAKQVVGTANESMGKLTESMAEITKASEETSKIIKTIDEIAFQTNLLALNAAVEAARAGEAGAGFAVVADEVRNLAMRAADAAKNTANLIEGTVKKVKDGSELVSRTNDAFKQVASSSAKAGDLVAEISAASNEQAQGIGQITTAVTELDKVTQQNAANAEESASASEEMSAQAETMKGMVDELVAIVGGSGKVQKADSRSGHREQKSAKPHKVLATAVNKIKAKAGSAKKQAQPVAAAAFPLDDDKQLADF